MQIIELYLFQVGGTFYRYTSAKRAYSYLSSSWQPLPIGRSSLTESGEVAKRSLDISFDINSEIAQLLLVNTSTVSVRLYRAFDGTVEIWFYGDMLGFSPAKNVLTVSFCDVLTRTKRSGIRRVCSKTCPFALYSDECGVVPSLVNASVSAISGNSVILSTSFDDGLFENGILFFGNSRGFVISQTGNTFVLKTVPSGMVAGSLVSLLKGCNQSIEVCRDRFSNLARYGGFPRVTLDNPFTTTDSL